MKRGWFCGFNGFHQFGSAHGRRTIGLSELPPHWIEDNYTKCCFAWSFNAFSRGREVLISGFVNGAVGGQGTFCFPEDIKCLQATDTFCLVLLKNGDLYKIDVRKGAMERMHFTSIERPRKRNIFGEEAHGVCNDAVELVACGRYICTAITKSNCVFNVPSKIYEFPKHEQIKSLVCGYEHALALTANGDVYSWGNGLRGQLGQVELRVEEAPVLVEALAGVKIKSISAGGWHSAAISSFGDLYLWGSNINGQLGIRIYTTTTTEKVGTSIPKKNQTVYPLPQLMELNGCCSTQDDLSEGNSCNVAEVVCGARHTFIRNECGRIFFCGWNEHNQLGQSVDTKFVDVFTELNLDTSFQNCNIYCGPWCTVVVLEKSASKNDLNKIEV